MDGTGRKRSSEENVCAEHSLPEKRAKGPRSPITSLKQLPCVSLSSRMAEESQSEAHDSAQSLSDDWNKVRQKVARLNCIQVHVCWSSKCLNFGVNSQYKILSVSLAQVVFSVSDSMKQMHIRPESISKLNLQQVCILPVTGLSYCLVHSLRILQRPLQYCLFYFDVLQ